MSHILLYFTCFIVSCIHIFQHIMATESNNILFNFGTVDANEPKWDPNGSFLSQARVVKWKIKSHIRATKHNQIALHCKAVQNLKCMLMSSFANLLPNDDMTFPLRNIFLLSLDKDMNINSVQTSAQATRRQKKNYKVRTNIIMKKERLLSSYSTTGESMMAAMSS